MNNAEYSILRSAVTSHEWLREVAYKFGLSHAEVAVTANGLFQSGDIKARVFTHKTDSEGTPNIVLTMPEIQAVLDGKLRASYELTSHGGAHWEFIAHADWNKYVQWDNYNNFVEGEIFECELVGISRKLMEDLLQIDCDLFQSIHIAGTEIWDTIEPWQPTYWKILPRANRIRYQAGERVRKMDSDMPLSWYERREQAQKRYSEIKEWYTDPLFEEESLNITIYTDANYDVAPNETLNKKVEYFILRNVVERYQDYEQDFGGVALNHNFSHSETLNSVFSLFRKGYILAEIYGSGTNVLDVEMTISQIQANLDRELQCYYYLTSQGGTYWEALAHPNWHRFWMFTNNDYSSYSHSGVNEYECEMICSDRQLIEQLLVFEYDLNFADIHISGTEVWDLIEPWQVTYWKTLPRGYRVRYQARRNKLAKDSDISPEKQAARNYAQQWFSEISKWYTDPEFDGI